MRMNYFFARRDYERIKGIVQYLREYFGNDFKKAPDDVRENIRHLARQAVGMGSLSLKAEDENAQVKLWRYQDIMGKLQPVFDRNLSIPLDKLAIAKGSYLLTINLPDGITEELPTTPSKGTIYYPMHIGHGETKRINILPLPQIPPGTAYIPAGPCLIGGPQARHMRLHEKKINAFFISKTEVTFGEYLKFWFAPDGGNRSPHLRSRIRLNPDDYRFLDAWDETGKLRGPCSPDRPVVGINQKAAAAYCEWLTKKTGRTHRLPTAVEWEKAARGVDGRDFPWGNGYADTNAYMLKSRNEDLGPWAPPTSVYGVNDMAGNVREWTSSTFPNSPYFQIKGGSASLTKHFLYCSYSSDTPVVPTDVGFRYVVDCESQ
jgi:serine/threonine-protein kinase